jgi:hypothetical protein
MLSIETTKLKVELAVYEAAVIYTTAKTRDKKQTGKPPAQKQSKQVRSPASASSIDQDYPRQPGTRPDPFNVQAIQLLQRIKAQIQVQALMDELDKTGAILRRGA